MKKKFAAADILILVLFIVCVAGICVRIILGDGGVFSADGDRGEYLVSYVVVGERSENSDFYADGTKFYLADGAEFGTNKGAYNTVLAKLENGEIDEAGKTVDVSATLIAEGTMTDSGFLLGGKTYIAPNMEIEIYSSDITATARIKSITKAS